MLQEIGKKAKVASREIATLSTETKNDILKSIKLSVDNNRDEILSANKLDVKSGKDSGLDDAMIDRLLLDDSRVDDMLSAVDNIISLEDPVGRIKDMKVLENGLKVGKRMSPLGVIGIIYESRPNVTLDSGLLTLKSGNALILKGGSEAINSNVAIANAIREGIESAGYNPDCVQLIEDTTRESTQALMKLSDYVDLLIPRGGGGLIRAVMENATVPVLETGEGVCHVYVDRSADINSALEIIANAKTQRTGVCNAMETLLVHKDIKEDFYQGLTEIIDEYDIEVWGDQRSREHLVNIKKADDDTYFTEYLSMAFSIKVVDSLDEAIEHINHYGTHHSDAIVTNDYTSSEMFLNEVDSACVYINASTRFTDGGELGLGAEMGISTQKMHARGPVGLEELTSQRYVIYGQGQVRK